MGEHLLHRCRRGCLGQDRAEVGCVHRLPVLEGGRCEPALGRAARGGWGHRFGLVVVVVVVVRVEGSGAAANLLLCAGVTPRALRRLLCQGGGAHLGT